MRIYKLKSVAQRSTAFVAAVSMLAGVGSGMVPVLASADALNPLTERTLSLSSSSPGWSFTDGSGNATYAYPNSGANGLKTGETFEFKVSSNNSGANKIYAYTFQYCTSAAGLCSGPGDGSGAGQSNLDVVTAVPAEISSGDWTTISSRTEGSPGSGIHAQIPKADDTEGNFVVLNGGSYSGGWTMSTDNVENGVSGNTGEQNYITLTNTSGVNATAGTQFKVIFFATDGNYITNPGSGAFFVKINNYNSPDYQNFADAYPLSGNHCLTGGTTYEATSPVAPCKANVIDGGVTVANVMNQSIAIQTKVLETMDFSVGTVDPDTLTPAEISTATGGARTAHGQCDPILMYRNPANPANTLTLGDTSAENSLRTDRTFATHSYWRLSSNSSGGATVYYAGSTLSNTEGDQIAPIGNTKAAPLTGNEQFGLAIDNAKTGTYLVNAASNGNLNETGADNGSANNGALNPTATTGWVAYQAANSTLVHNPQLFPLVADTNYADGSGNINSTDGTIDTNFSFDSQANTVPRAIAQENTQVVNCVTAKIRYIANIAATTPAGIYTTKINYVASPQY